MPKRMMLCKGPLLVENHHLWWNSATKQSRD